MDSFQKYEYYAFISYKHKQTENKKFIKDEEWAKILKKGLQSLKIPTQISKDVRLNQNGRVDPIYRDTENHLSGYDLDELTYNSLSKSKTLIVIISKEMLEDQFDIRYKQGKEAWIFNEIECYIGLGNKMESIIPFYVGDEEINPNDIIKEIKERCDADGVECKALDYLYQPGRIIKKVGDLKEKGKEINQYASAIIAASIFNSDSHYFVDAYKLEQEKRKRRLICLVLVVVSCLIIGFSFIYYQSKLIRTEEAFRYVELSKRAEKALDLQGARILALKAYEKRPELFEAKYQLYKMANSYEDKPYAMLPFSVLVSDDGAEVMHFQGNKFLIRRIKDLSVIDSIFGVRDFEKVLLNGKKQIAFVGPDSLKIYDREKKTFFLHGFEKRNDNLWGEIVDYHFPLCSNKFLELHENGYVIDWNLLTNEFVKVKINNCLDTIYNSVFSNFLGNVNDSCVAFSYKLDSVFYINRYNCISHEIRKIDSIQIGNHFSYCYNESTDVLLYREGKYIYLRTKDRQEILLDSLEGSINSSVNMSFNKKGDRCFVASRYNGSYNRIKIFNEDGVFVKRIEPYFLKEIKHICWSSKGDLCLICDDKLFAYSEDDNFSEENWLKICPTGYSFHDIMIYDSVIVATTGFNECVYDYNLGVSMFYDRENSNRNEDYIENEKYRIRKRYFLPDGVHYIETLWREWRDYSRCVNSLTDSIVWISPYEIEKISPNRNFVVVSKWYSDGFEVLDVKDGSIIYKNDSSRFCDFLTEKVILIKNVDREDGMILHSDHKIYNFEDSILLASGSFCGYSISKDYFVCIKDSANVVVTNIENGKEIAEFSLPKKKYEFYFLYFSPCANYVFITCFTLQDKYDEVDYEMFVFDVKNKRVRTLENGFSPFVFVTKDGKYAIASWTRNAFVYDLKSMSIVKILQFEKECSGIDGYISNNSVFIGANSVTNGYELNIKNWTLKESEYRSVMESNNFLELKIYPTGDVIVCDKEVFFLKGKKGLKFVSKGYIDYINDSIFTLGGDIESVFRIGEDDEWVKYLQELVGERELSQYDIYGYGREYDNRW